MTTMGYYRRKEKQNAADIDRVIALARRVFRGRAMDSSNDDRSAWYDPIFYGVCGFIVGACFMVVVLADGRLSW